MSDLPEEITRCSRYLGFHAFGAGPCFDTIDDAVSYRDRLKTVVVVAEWRSETEMVVPDDWEWDGSLQSIVEIQDFTSANAELIDYEVRADDR